MNDEQKLLNCPFCGGKSITSEKGELQDKQTHRRGFVGCPNCHCFIGWYHGDIGKNLAIKVWNSRV